MGSWLGEGDRNCAPGKYDIGSTMRLLNVHLVDELAQL
jgi:hypothetical protein